ncbi:MAG TPA: class I SAM-dependent methyltransferase [Thermoplasmata archaeon]|nr:class I SAM-dependent methyltransferase [Thermoplasmata archaeon]
MSGPRSLMFGSMAPAYDLLYAQKDYAAEARFLAGLARRIRRTTGGVWLDVACGTGRHLDQLQRWYTVAGVDRSGEMLAIARRRLPRVRLTRGDMRSFRLTRRFDVISCLFSAIGHLQTESDLVSTFANFERHLAPGGVALVEPWLLPEDLRVGSVHVVSAQRPELAVARLAFSRVRGRHTLIEYRYLLGRPGRGIAEYRETDRGLVVSSQRLVELMERAGLDARFLRYGPMARRGLLVGRKLKRSRVGPRGRT